jgi:DNA-binding NtrC family response regulator
LILRQLWLKNVRQIKNFINRCISRIDWENFDIITVNIVIEELALEYGIEKQNTGKSLSELLDNLVNYLLDNREKLFDNSVKGENFGGLKYLNSLFEKKLLLETLNRTDGNILAASRYLYENKDTLRNHIKNLDLT